MIERLEEIARSGPPSAAIQALRALLDLEKKRNPEQDPLFAELDAVPLPRRGARAG